MDGLNTVPERNICIFSRIPLTEEDVNISSEKAKKKSLKTWKLLDSSINELYGQTTWTCYKLNTKVNVIKLNHILSDTTLTLT